MMSPHGVARSRLRLIVRAALVLAGLATYLISPDDVVWHLIKAAPHSRVLEHAFFGLAAALLGLALLLKVKSGPHPENPDSREYSRTTGTVARVLEAIGIGSLLPLPGFLLLVLGDLAASLLLGGRQSIAEDPRTERDAARAQSPLPGSQWRTTWATHIGLCLAFLSMAVFSVVLVDRVADVLFALTALVSIVANLRLFLSVHR
jgi:hypothetical protein